MFRTFCGILANKLVVSVPVYWILFRAELSAFYLTHISSIILSSRVILVQSQSTNLFYSILNRFPANMTNSQSSRTFLARAVAAQKYHIFVSVHAYLALSVFFQDS